MSFFNFYKKLVAAYITLKTTYVVLFVQVQKATLMYFYILVNHLSRKSSWEYRQLCICFDNFKNSIITNLLVFIIHAVASMKKNYWIYVHSLASCSWNCKQHIKIQWLLIGQVNTMNENKIQVMGKSCAASKQLHNFSASVIT